MHVCLGERWFIELEQVEAHFCNWEDGWLNKMLVLCNGQSEFLRLLLKVEDADFSVQDGSVPAREQCFLRGWWRFSQATGRDAGEV